MNEEHNNRSKESTEKAPKFIIYDDGDVEEGVDLCARSLVGRFLTQKPIHTNSLQNALAGIWCNPKGFRVEEVVPHTFQFFFDDESDVERIIKGSPWIFHNSWLILKRWMRDENIDSIEFNLVDLKVQIWGLPAHCKTSKMGVKIGTCLRKVL
ncbi:hypothetical protein SESBI_02640 [Sesbania bispinosa]|nr:hypothetical protein SESBI_02640 [Sesbania bispinosa]